MRILPPNPSLMNTVLRDYPQDGILRRLVRSFANPFLKTRSGGVFTVCVLLSSTALAAPPAVVSSFGPNGTHWPNLVPTPFIHDESPNDIEVECSWGAIEEALKSVTNEQAAEGVRILVQPGSLPGFGAGGGNKAVLFQLGSLEWPKRVLICPRDGYGSVDSPDPIKIQEVHGICVAGFNFRSVKLSGCSRSAIAWCRIQSWFATYGERSVPLVDKFEVTEIVMPDTGRAANQDRSDQYASFSNCTNWKYEGCYFAPRYYLDNSLPRPHIDTMQFGPIPAGSWFDVTIKDTTVYPSNNAAINGGFIDATFDHILVLGGRSLGRLRHPVPPGGEDGNPNGNGDIEGFPAFNGTARDVTIRNSYIWGGLTFNTGQGTPIWKEVTNTMLDRAPSGRNRPAIGEWTINDNAEEYLAMQPPIPTDEYLRSIWTKDGAGVPEGEDPQSAARPQADPRAGTFLLPQTISLSTSTPEAEIYYTLDGSEPSSASLLYGEPFELSRSAVVKAIAQSPDLNDSAILSASYDIGSAMEASADWMHLGIGNQRNDFSIEWTAVPSSADIDGVMGLGRGEATQFNDLACIVRFGPGGVIDARDGSRYRSEADLSYEEGVEYRFRLIIHASTRKYDVIVVEPSGERHAIAQNFSYRTSQQSVTELDTFNFRGVTESRFAVSNFEVTPAVILRPTGFRRVE